MKSGESETASYIFIPRGNPFFITVFLPPLIYILWQYNAVASFGLLSGKGYPGYTDNRGHAFKSLH